MDKSECMANSLCCLSRNFWDNLKPVAECCSNEVTDTLQHLSKTWSTSTPSDEARAIYLELETAIMSVEKYSLLIAGVLMLVATLVLILGTCYMTCFQNDTLKYSAVPQFDFLDEGMRDLESLIHMLSEMNHPLHKTVKHLASEFEEFDLFKSKESVSDL
ncbi:unnamed protein product [Mytilus coruscus]|uniref:Uncharacterized protein n=1 Tax=Mytilus coruscus TaxID=42192 RepID=A0A6J8C0H9_MYTCO|nr:unnamed protein product [Mytilus coruscus]